MGVHKLHNLLQIIKDQGEFLTDEDKKLAQSVIDGSYSMPGIQVKPMI